MNGLVRFISCSVNFWKVFGIGVAASPTGMTVVTDDWKFYANVIEWKVYLGPLLIRGIFPYRVWRGSEPQYCSKPNNAVTGSGAAQ